MTEDHDSLWNSDTSSDPQQQRIEHLLGQFSAEARGLGEWKPQTIEDAGVELLKRRLLEGTKFSVVAVAIAMIGASQAYKLH